MKKITYDLYDPISAKRIQCLRCMFVYHLTGYPGIPIDKFNGWLEWCNQCIARVPDTCTLIPYKPHLCAICGGELVDFSTWLLSKQPDHAKESQKGRGPS